IRGVPSPPIRTARSRPSNTARYRGSPSPACRSAKWAASSNNAASASTRAAWQASTASNVSTTSRSPTTRDSIPRTLSTTTDSFHGSTAKPLEAMVSTSPSPGVVSTSPPPGAVRRARPPSTSEANRGGRRHLGAHGPPQLSHRTLPALFHQPGMVSRDQVPATEVRRSQRVDPEADVGLRGRPLRGGLARIGRPDPPAAFVPRGCTVCHLDHDVARGPPGPVLQSVREIDQPPPQTVVSRHVRGGPRPADPRQQRVLYTDCANLDGADQVEVHQPAEQRQSRRRTARQSPHNHLAVWPRQLPLVRTPEHGESDVHTVAPSEEHPPGLLVAELLRPLRADSRVVAEGADHRPEFRGGEVALPHPLRNLRV